MTLNYRRWHNVSAVVYGLPFIIVGLQHFITPEVFEPIVPAWLGWPWLWVHLTGWTEVGLGLGIMAPRTRRFAAWLMAGQLILLYAANLNMWLNDIPFQGVQMGTGGHVVRMLVQVLLIAAAVGIARSGAAGED